MHGIHSTRQNRIAIAALEQAANDRILERRYACCITDELHLAEDTFNRSTGCLNKCNKASSNSKVVDAGGGMICLPPLPNPPCFLNGIILPCT